MGALAIILLVIGVVEFVRLARLLWTREDHPRSAWNWRLASSVVALGTVGGVVIGAPAFAAYGGDPLRPVIIAVTASVVGLGASAALGHRATVTARRRPPEASPPDRRR